LEALLSNLPEIGYLRVRDILGDRSKGIPAIIPVSRATWWAGVKSGRFPAGVLLGPRIRIWAVEDIRALVASISNDEVV
jgi:prophage regulatory protein